MLAGTGRAIRLGGVLELRLFIEANEDGREFFELVAARSTEPGLFEVVNSPGMIPGLAAGDVIRVEEAGRFVVVRRSGNTCLQTFVNGLSEEYRQTCVDMMISLAPAYGGRFDVRSEVVAVFTFMHRDFGRIAEFTDRIRQNFSELEWVIGNP